MNLHKLIFTKNRCYKEGRKITPKGIMVHSTGANNPTLKRYVGPDDGLLGRNIYGNHWNRSFYPGKCCHAFIGKLADGTVATYQVLPWDHRGWHAGADANNTHISFEICEDNLLDGEYFSKVYQEAIDLCVYLCKMYGLTEKDIIDHREGAAQGIASNHGDIAHWWPKHGKSMDTFRAAVKLRLEEQEPAEETKPAENPEPTNVTLDVAKSFLPSKSGTYKITAGPGLWLRTGASKSKPTLELMPYGSTVRCYGYYTGNWLFVRSASGKEGFCSKAYLKKV